jgi:hypothetical protein
MKNLRIAVIAVLAAFTIVSLANADDFKSKPVFKKVVNVTLDKAGLIPGLIPAIYEQVDEEVILDLPNTDVYIAQVQFQGNTYRITGTRNQWLTFFNRKGVSPVKFIKGPGIG